MYVKDLKIGALYRPKSPNHYFGSVRENIYVDWGKRLESRLMVYLGETRDEDGYLERWCMVGGKKFSVRGNEWRKIEPVEEM
jgi:hypothetical protein